MDESESGEAYDKMAGQRPRLARDESPQKKRRDQLSPQLEAKLVRAVMSETATISLLSKKLGLESRTVKQHLKRLGLDKLVSNDSATRKTRTAARRNRRSLARPTASH